MRARGGPPMGEMSRTSSRATTIVAFVAILLFVVLFVILWTGIDTTVSNETESIVERKLEDDATNTNNVVTEEDDASKGYQDSTLDVLPSGKGDLEYIKLMKISQNQYEDPPEKISTAKRHHSGHFRHSTAAVWDPHPQYEFTAFGRRFRLQLAHDSSFVLPDVKVTHISENTTRREHAGHQLGCFYSGSVDGDPNSVVTVNLCHGMTGHMKTSSGSYFIEPAAQWQSDEKDSLISSLQHAIYRVPAVTYASNKHGSSNDLPASHNCGVIDYDTDNVPVPLTDTSAGKIYVGERTRKRRSLTRRTTYRRYRTEQKKDGMERNKNVDAFQYEQFVGPNEDHRTFLKSNDRYEGYHSVERRRDYSNEEHVRDTEMESDPFVTLRPRRALPREYFIEIMVVADSKMVQYHHKNLVSYVLVLMSTVSRIYKDQSVGNPISIAVTKIVKMDKAFGSSLGDNYGIAAADMLKEFCQWQKRNNPDEPSPEHHDAALLLTRENLCLNPRQKYCDTLGLAELGKMCSPGSSCVIVQDNGLAAAFTIAHEIGHVLNMPHDDDPKCNEFRNRYGVHNIMSRSLDNNSFPWEWSKCSRHYVTEFLEAGLHANCLLDEPTRVIDGFAVNRLPGEDYSENRQCELVFGRGSKICPHMVSDVCRRLWCTAPIWDRRHHCHTQHMPWADGTPCGERKWCHRGECVARRHLKPVDGQWGLWGQYDECSRTCGGGVKKKYRECNNPAPQNGGNYCVGDRVKYDSCGTKECPLGSPDFREQQCSKFDNNNLNIQNLARDVKWHAKYTRILPHDRCKLYCQVESNQYYMLRDKVVDGTPCGPDTFHLCVNGQCKPAGCDHVLNSAAELDTCGVCKGNNSTCQRITGAYNSTAYGYTRVAKIPAGSSYIDIRQYGWMGSNNDSNYLALRLGEGGEYILNGNFMVMHRKVVVHSGVTIEYSGPESVVERLNSSRPISTDLILEILSVYNIYPPQIEYEYTVPKRILNNFTWVLSDWSNCNLTCQGTMYRKAECRHTENKELMQEDFCYPHKKPPEQSQTCNENCTLQWHMVSKSECSNHCGLGTRTVTWLCVISYSKSGTQNVPGYVCSHLEEPQKTEKCIGPCNDAHWSYGKWSTCDVSCGGGVQVRTAKCVDSNNNDVSNESCAEQEKNLKRLCGQKVCPKWDFGKWSACSVTCGIGKRQREYWCQEENVVVSHLRCGGTPIGIESCNAGPCHQWNMIFQLPNTLYYDPSQQDNEIDSNDITSRYKWQAVFHGKVIRRSEDLCFAKCNSGGRAIKMECISTETGQNVLADHCESIKRPDALVNCNRDSCPIWNTGGWSEWTNHSGRSYRQRQVRCQNPRGEALPEERCSREHKPLAKEECWNPPCGIFDVTYRWKKSKWTVCPKSCGDGGFKTRSVQCVAIRRSDGSEVPVKDELCSKLSRQIKPKSRRPCQYKPCGFTWQKSAWSKCSAMCDHGIQRRNITCHRVNDYGWVDPDQIDGCRMYTRFKTERPCKIRNCKDEYYWEARWKKCSHQCGKGQQTREMFCYKTNGDLTNTSNCRPISKLKKTRDCNRACGLRTCVDAQQHFKTSQDDEYTLLIGGKNMSIYCHLMSTRNPREYLTLPAGDEANYAEIYHERYSGRCLFDEGRNNNCNCDEYMSRTMFNRVRLDPHRLYIIANDYTFSRIKGVKKMEFGKAGYCFSRKNCPQGFFSIDLSGTQLKLSSNVKWFSNNSTIDPTVNKINDQHIIGMCGGSCNTCMPKLGLKLDVLPP